MIAKASFCHSCGQKTDIHRLTLKRFFSYNLIHKCLYVDQLFTSTLRDVLIRPHLVAQEYIDGKRKKYFNLASILGLLIALYLIIEKSNPTSVENPEKIEAFFTFLENHTEALFFATIPVFALAAKVIFWRPKHTIIEFGVVALVSIVGGSLLAVFDNVIYVLSLLKYQSLDNFPIFLRTLSDGLTILCFAFRHMFFTGI